MSSSDVPFSASSVFASISHPLPVLTAPGYRNTEALACMASLTAAARDMGSELPPLHPPPPPPASKESRRGQGGGGAPFKGGGGGSSPPSLRWC